MHLSCLDVVCLCVSVPLPKRTLTRHPRDGKKPLFVTSGETQCSLLPFQSFDFPRRHSCVIRRPRFSQLKNVSVSPLREVKNCSCTAHACTPLSSVLP